MRKKIKRDKDNNDQKDKNRGNNKSSGSKKEGSKKDFKSFLFLRDIYESGVFELGDEIELYSKDIKLANFKIEIHEKGKSEKLVLVCVECSKSHSDMLGIVKIGDIFPTLTTLKKAYSGTGGNGWKANLFHIKSGCKLEDLRDELENLVNKYYDIPEEIDDMEEITIFCDTNNNSKHQFHLKKNYLRNKIEKIKVDIKKKNILVQKALEQEKNSKKYQGKDQKTPKKKINNTSSTLSNSSSPPSSLSSSSPLIIKGDEKKIIRKKGDIEIDMEKAPDNDDENHQKKKRQNRSISQRGENGKISPIQKNVIGSTTAKREIPKKVLARPIEKKSTDTKIIENKSIMTLSDNKNLAPPSSLPQPPSSPKRIEKLNFFDFKTGKFKILFQTKNEYSNFLHISSTMSIEISTKLIFKQLDMITSLMSDLNDLEFEWNWNENAEKRKKKNEEMNNDDDGEYENNDYQALFNKRDTEEEGEIKEGDNKMNEKDDKQEKRDDEGDADDKGKTNIGEFGMNKTISFDDDDNNNNYDMDSASDSDSDSQSIFEHSSVPKIIPPPIKYTPPDISSNFTVCGSRKVSLSEYSKDHKKQSGSEDLTYITEIECQFNFEKNELIKYINYIYYFKMNKNTLEMINSLRREKNLQPFEWLEFENEQKMSIKNSSMFSWNKKKLLDNLDLLCKDDKEENGNDDSQDNNKREKGLQSYVNKSQRILFLKYYIRFMDLFEEALEINHVDDNVNIWAKMNEIFSKIIEEFKVFHKLKMEVFKEETQIREKKQLDIILSFTTIIKEIAHQVCTNGETFDSVSGGDTINGDNNNNGQKHKIENLLKWVDIRLEHTFLGLTNDLNSLQEIKKINLNYMRREFSVFFSEILSKKSVFDNDKITELFNQMMHNTKQNFLKQDANQSCPPQIRDYSLFCFFEGTKNSLGTIQEKLDSLTRKKEEEIIMRRQYNEIKNPHHEYITEKKRKLKRKYQDMKDELLTKTNESLRLKDLENQKIKDENERELQHYRILYQDVYKNYEDKKKDNQKLENELSLYKQRTIDYDEMLKEKKNNRIVLKSLLGGMNDCDELFDRYNNLMEHSDQAFPKNMEHTQNRNPNNENSNINLIYKNNYNVNQQQQQQQINHYQNSLQKVKEKEIEEITHNFKITNKKSKIDMDIDTNPIPYSPSSPSSHFNNNNNNKSIGQSNGIGSNITDLKINRPIFLNEVRNDNFTRSNNNPIGNNAPNINGKNNNIIPKIPTFLDHEFYGNNICNNDNNLRENGENEDHAILLDQFTFN